MMRPDHLKISACVTAGNEEDKIAACLASLSWCDETIVVDSFSRDKTFEISKQYNSPTSISTPGKAIAQKNYIRPRPLSLILFVDADEVVSKALRDEIETGPSAAPATWPATASPAWSIISANGSATANGTRTSNCACSEATAAIPKARNPTTASSWTALSKPSAPPLPLHLRQPRRPHPYHQPVLLHHRQREIPPRRRLRWRDLFFRSPSASSSSPTS